MLIYFISRLYKAISWEIIVINWTDIMNMIFKKQIIRRSYPNIHLHINYVRSFQEICIYFDWQRHPNGRQWPITGHYLQRCSICRETTSHLPDKLLWDQTLANKHVIVQSLHHSFTTSLKNIFWCSNQNFESENVGKQSDTVIICSEVTLHFQNISGRAHSHGAMQTLNQSILGASICGPAD